MAAGSTTFEVFRSGPRLCRASASADSGYQYDSAALMQQEAVSVRGTGISHLRRTPLVPGSSQRDSAARDLAASGK
jgi:hypothetical protein